MDVLDIAASMRLFIHDEKTDWKEKLGEEVRDFIQPTWNSKKEKWEFESKRFHVWNIYILYHFALVGDLKNAFEESTVKLVNHFESVKEVLYGESPPL